MNGLSILQEADWCAAGDGFALCREPLSMLLHRMGIQDTGLSPINPRDVDSYFDDWHLFSVGVRPVYGLVKLREQEHDFLPGFADRDDPSVSISFVAFPLESLEQLPQGADAKTPEMRRFVECFRDVTERFPQRHDPALQAYFSDPRSRGSYLIARAYVKKLLGLSPEGTIPLPDKFFLAPRRLLRGLEAINAEAGRAIFCPEERCLRIEDPAHPTLLEQRAVLAVHTCNLDFYSFAAEVKFHADALVSWPRHLPYIGKRRWYRSAIRADMQFEPESFFYEKLLCPYYHPDSAIVKEQIALHEAEETKENRLWINTH